jgi:LuxR family transcriptional regulator, maltose regulon positive regulatory protein
MGDNEFQEIAPLDQELPNKLPEQNSVNLFATKLSAPPPRSTLVARPRLAAKLDGGLQGRLTLVCAPAGFGKTTLITDWFHQKIRGDGGRKETPVEGRLRPQPQLQIAWISLDEDDNDPLRFITCLAAAVDTLRSGAAAHIAPLLQSQPLPPPKTVVASLMNALGAAVAQEPSPGSYYALVIDDYHLISQEAVHQSIVFLLENQPTWLHLTILTRIDPPLPVPRLRACHQLTEIRAADLRFTADEAASFLNQVMKLDLSPDDVSALESRTEGWIAGLQMAALSMQGRPDIPAFIKAFTGSHRYIIDYLIEEVFERQSEEIRDFLLQTAILDRLCGPLCEAVTAQSGGQISLEELEASNLFLVPLDDERHWYRYHHLFRDVLRSRLLRRYPDRLPALHRRAARWYEATGAPEAAVPHWLSANDFEAVERLLEGTGGVMLMSGRWSLLLEWLDAIPDAVLRQRPLLCMFKAWALYLTGQWQRVESYLQDVERLASLEEDPAWTLTPDGEGGPLTGWRGQVATLRSQMASRQGDSARAIEQSQKALAWLPQDDLLMRGIVATNLGFAYLSLDDWPEAERLLREGRSATAASGNESMALSAANGLRLIEIAHGRLRAAAAYFRELLQEATPRLDQAVIGAHYHLGGLLYEWNDLPGALDQVSQARDLANQLQITRLCLLCDLLRAQIRQAQGDHAGAVSLVQAARMKESSATADQVVLVAARLAAGRDDKEVLEKFLRHVPEIQDRPYTSERRSEYYARVQAWLALSKLAEAEALLETLRPAVQACGHHGALIEYLALQALLSWQRRDRGQATSLLEQALALAQPEGYVRTFVDFGPTMQALLQNYRISLDPEKGKEPRRQLAAYVDKLLAAFSRIKPVPEKFGASEALLVLPPAEALSGRELEVLRLMADGLSNRAIAETLFLSVGTVKTHAHNIYVKLDVQSRTQAIAHARELGMLLDH